MSARAWLKGIHAIAPDHMVRIMNVCGGHERVISEAGLRSVLPKNITLIPGPGCPVCVCPEEDIFAAIQLALKEDVAVAAFGDMLRAPVNVSPKEARSLEEARARGGTILPMASPTEAARWAEAHPQRQLVFLAAGFETTTAPVAAMLAQNPPDNLSVLLAARLTWPAVAGLLASGEAHFDGLVAPGHVATVMGPEEWAFIPRDHGLPVAVAGFTPESMLAALHSLLKQIREGTVLVDNCYPASVHPGGNPGARSLLNDIMTVVDAPWRGLGIIPQSGFQLRPPWDRYDARKRFGIQPDADRKRAGAMPPGCDCAQVVMGRIPPNLCRLYGKPCTPRTPIGPCMVSDEGACRIWWSHGSR
ncbi:MAG: hydrogenase formation protein HypD [Magnetococcales bacterium]|nr:hydrogenase formation protein HypD [Magnetococcales bacterium]